MAEGGEALWGVAMAVDRFVAPLQKRDAEQPCFSYPFLLKEPKDSQKPLHVHRPFAKLECSDALARLRDLVFEAPLTNLVDDEHRLRAGSRTFSTFTFIMLPEVTTWAKCCSQLYVNLHSCLAVEALVACPALLATLRTASDAVDVILKGFFDAPAPELFQPFLDGLAAEEAKVADATFLTAWARWNEMAEELKDLAGRDEINVAKALDDMGEIIMTEKFIKDMRAVTKLKSATQVTDASESLAELYAAMAEFIQNVRVGSDCVAKFKDTSPRIPEVDSIICNLVALEATVKPLKKGATRATQIANTRAYLESKHMAPSPKVSLLLTAAAASSAA